MKNTFSLTSRFRKPSEYKKLQKLMPEHSRKSLENILRKKIDSVVIDEGRIQLLLDLYTSINQGTRKKHEFYEFESEHIFKFIKNRAKLMHEKAPYEEKHNIGILRSMSHTIHRMLTLIYRNNYDYQVDGVYVYRKRVPSRFLYNFRAVASDTIGYFTEEKYKEVLGYFIQDKRYLEALTLALLYRTGMDGSEITYLTTDLLNKERNLDGSITTGEVVDNNDNISTYDIGEEELEIMELWLEHRGFNHNKIMATTDGYRESELSVNWAFIFWKFDVQPEFDIDYSYHYLMHDDKRTVIEWKSKSLRIEI